MKSNWFAVGAIAAAIGVTLGAFGAHALKSRVTEDLLSVFEIGVRYQMYHAFGLLAVAWAAARWPGSLPMHRVGCLRLEFSYSPVACI